MVQRLDCRIIKFLCRHCAAFSFCREVVKLAATRLIALHKNKGKSVAACLKSRTDYAQNPDKTQQGELVSSYECSPLTVDEEFMLSKRQYELATGRRQKSDVIAYQIRQSFKPGEITAEEANKVGYELAMRFTKGKYALIFLCIAGVSIPSFFFASTYLDIFAVKLGLTSVVGNTGLMRYLPAAVCIAIGCIALFSPMLANNIEKEMEQDSAFYARCRGLSEGKILLRYALPSAVVTLLPSFCQMLGLCMAGSAIVERVFSLPGLGYLIIDSVLYRDSPVIHATILFLAFSLVMFNTLSDVLRRILQRDTSSREGARL